MIIEPIQVAGSSLSGRMPSPVPWRVSNVAATQTPNQTIARELATQAGEEEFLTVNMVMSEVGDNAQGSAGFGRLLFALAALAHERFGAAPENHYPDALREIVPSSLPGIPVDPFDGQLLRFREADGGYQLHGIGADLRDDPSGKGDLAATVVGLPQVSPPEGPQSHRHLPALIKPGN